MTNPDHGMRDPIDAEQGPQTPPLGKRLFRPKNVIAGLLAVSMVAGFWLARTRLNREGIHPGPSEEPSTLAAPADPRLSYSGPFRNIHPDVKYVGDAECAGCHGAIADSYSRHPMGRSLVPIAQLASLQPYDAQHHNPFEESRIQFLVEREGDRVWHRQTRFDTSGRLLSDRKWEVHYAVGSGARGYSYLVDRDGFLFQTGISWYGQKQIWARSPGFDALRLSVRPIPGLCLYCHANQAHFREGSVNRYDPPVFTGHAIGCERCHGPGALHVQSRRRRQKVNGVDLTIVNPRHLEPDLREAVCQQCHLEGEARVARRGRQAYDFRPGLPLDAVWSFFVRAERKNEANRKAVNHVEQMYQSSCFRGSSGPNRLGCNSCHDPHVHVGPKERLAHYRDRCLRCHVEQSCSLPVAERRKNQDSCIDCHMPRYGASDIPHTASTDHSIPRRPQKRPAAPEFLPPALYVGGYPVKPFAKDGLDLQDRELTRDLGIALANLVAQRKAEPFLTGNQALPLLEGALQGDPADVEAREALARVFLNQDRQAGALAAFKAVLRDHPDRETALVGAGSMAQALRQPEAALDFWRRAVQVNPWLPEYRRRLAQLLAAQNAWDEVRPQCRAWLELDPESVTARALWINCLLQAGDKAGATEEFARLEALRPPNLEEIRAWFADQLR